MKTLLENYLSQYTDRFNCRYICKRDPELWEEVLKATSFLPETALPKQRCWHILNDVWEIPLCPVENIPVSWNENRYLTYASISAKAKCPESVARRVASYEARTGYKGHWSSNPEVRAQILEKRKANPQRGFKRSQEWRDKIKATWDEKLGVDWTPEKRQSFKLYRRRVDQITNRNYKYRLEEIKDNHLPRSKDGFHLDHIYSVFDGWKNNVDPETISHPLNLRMITREVNSKKQHRSDRTLDDLYEAIERR